MATWRTVADAIQRMIAPALATADYPSTAVYVGFPEPQRLLDDLRANPGRKAHVTIYPNMHRRSTNETRYIGDPCTVKLPVTETTTVVGTDVTIGGTITAGDNVFLFVNTSVFSVTAASNSTPSSLASSLAGLVNAANVGLTASAVGATISFSGTVWYIKAKVFGLGQVFREVGRFAREFEITVWARNDTDRELISSKIIELVCKQKFLTCSDTSKARIVFASDEPFDGNMVSGLMRYDVYVDCEWPHFEVQTGTVVGSVKQTLTVVQQEVQTQIQTLAPTNITLAQLAAGPTKHSHVHEIPTGSRPGTTFQLSLVPLAGSERISLNQLLLRRTYGVPAVNQYTLDGNILTLGFAISSGDFLWVEYEI